MLVGVLRAGSVRAYKTRVTVDGVDRPVVSVDLDGSMRHDLPAQISRSSGASDRGGSIKWAAPNVVTDKPVTAFRDYGNWRPRKGQKVVVYQGDGVTEWRRFTGVIDETTGSIGSGMTSTIVVDVDRLTEEFSCEAHLSSMPPLTDGGAWRNAGLSPMYFVDAAMRAGGYYVTPPTLPYAALNVPLQGSMLPAVGTSAQLLTGTGNSGGGAYQENWSAPWGLTAGNFNATYQPAFARTPDQPVMISAMLTTAHAALAYITVHYGGTSNYLRLLMASNRGVFLQRMRGTELVEVARLQPSQMEAATRVEVLVKNGVATLRNNAGHSVTGSVSGLLNNPMSRIDITAPPAARIAGVQVAHPETWQEFQYLNFTNTARIRTHDGNATTWGVTNAAPRFEAAPASSVLEDLADATLSGMWFDEQGVLNFAPANGIRSQAPMQTITTADDVLALAWSDRLLAVASRITVGYLHPALKNGSLRSIEVARGSNQALRSKEQIEDVYTPAADEEWIGVDDTLTVLGANMWGGYNAGVGSIAGVIYTAEGETTSSAGLSTSISMQKTGLSEYTVKHEAGTFPSDVVAETVTSPTSVDLWPRNRDRALPVIRAYAYVKWVEREVTRTANQVGPVLRIDLGGQATPATAERVRDYLHSVVSSPYPQITDLEVVPDPRRQIGDVITIKSENYMGVTLRCMVTSINESMSGVYAQSLGLDVLAVTTGALTWREWENAYPGTLTYEQWLSLRGQTDTYNDFNTDPLKGA